MGCKETNHKTEYRTPHSPHLRPAGAKGLALPIKGGSPVMRKHKPKPVQAESSRHSSFSRAPEVLPPAVWYLLCPQPAVSWHRCPPRLWHLSH